MDLIARINAIHACTCEAELRGAYGEHIEAVAGDDAAEWVIREATYAMKLRLGLAECEDDGPEYMPDDERDYERRGCVAEGQP